MRDFLNAAKLLLLDLASTIFFLVLFLLTHNTILSVSLGMALGLAQIGTQFVRRKPIDTMEWLSLFLVVAAGTATLLTNDPRFVLFKPSVIYVIVGAVMLKPGWMNRYLPGHRKGGRARRCFGFGLRLGEPYVLVRYGECVHRPDLQLGDVGLGHADFWHREQGDSLPLRICRFALHRQAPRARYASPRT